MSQNDGTEGTESHRGSTRTDASSQGQRHPVERETAAPRHATSRPVEDSPSRPVEDTERRRVREEYRGTARGDLTTVDYVPPVSRIRGGPVWGGFTIALATWILLEVGMYAAGVGGLAANIVPDADTATWWWSGVAAAIAFFIGGLVAGASSVWHGITDGILQGITVWSMIILALLALSTAGAGIGFGVMSDVLATSPELIAGDDDVLRGTQDGAAAAVLALSVTLGAAALGGALGSKMWPGHRPTQTIDVR